MTGEQHTVQTQYGEATIKTYECDSCGNRVAYENTVEFSIGDRDGRACEHCEQNGPISFPERVREWALPKDGAVDNEWSVVPYTLLFPLFAPVLLIDGLHTDGDVFSSGYATALISTVVWCLVCALVLVVAPI